jgi:hypothetical protein
VSKSSAVRRKLRPLLEQGARVASIGTEAMTENDTAAEKRIVEQLNFGAKTAKRTGWEAWEFYIAGPHQVEVTNASYGFEKDDHSYVVGIEKRDSVPIPAECECPADKYNEEYDCKHKVALATVGGTTVLNAAVDFEKPGATLSSPNPDDVTTAADKLQTDGGTATVSEDSDTCPNGDERCDGPTGEELPCFDCFELSEGR